jgi:DNA-binding response OmpR family regulator
LALSLELIKMHSGQILAESVPGEGSTFIVRLPKGKDHFSNVDFVDKRTEIRSHDLMEIDEINIQQSEITQQKSSDLPKVLLVEDNPEIMDYLKSSFIDYFSLSYAGNGVEGLKMIKENQPELIITDIMMPEMDGIEMTKLIKEDFDISHIPVVMLTARSNMDDQIGGIESGAEAYVLKPFNSDYLRAVITNLLKQRKLIMTRNSRPMEFSPGKIKVTNRDELFMNHILELIKEKYSSPEFNVELLCQSSNLSRTVFYHKIKSLTGLTPVDFLKQMRLKISAQLILEEGSNIAEVAYSCGFNDEKYFRKCFK